MLASAPTELGSPIQNDGKIQMVGGDILTVTYIDDSTLAGEKEYPERGKFVQSVQELLDFTSVITPPQPISPTLDNHRL